MLSLPPREVCIGILGMGDIGAVTAERLLMFDFQVIGWSRSRKSVPGVTSFAGKEELPKFLGPLRYPGLHVAADTGNREPDGRQTVRRAAQGRLGDECGAAAAIATKRICWRRWTAAIWAARCWTFSRPNPCPPDSISWTHPNVTVTPHIAGITDPRNAAAFVVDCVARAETGAPFKNVVDLNRGY